MIKPYPITDDRSDTVYLNLAGPVTLVESGVAGTGLGLAIAQEIIDQHQGRIEVESEGNPGKGAIFSVWSPALSRER